MLHVPEMKKEMFASFPYFWLIWMKEIVSAVPFPLSHETVSSVVAVAA